MTKLTMTVQTLLSFVTKYNLTEISDIILLELNPHTVY